MSVSELIIRGEDRTLIASVSIDGARDISTATEITAVLTDMSRSSTTENGATITCADSGLADWRSGKVAVPFTSVQTAAMSTSTYELEIKATISGVIRKGFSAQSVVVSDSKS